MRRILLFVISLTAATCTFAQVTQINSNQSLSVIAPLPSGKTILASGIDSSIWVTDGTLAGTIKLSANIFYRDAGGLLNGKFIFKASTPATGTEVFITDGSVAGTTVLSDIVSGAGSSNPDDDFALLNGYLYFFASRAAEGRELWRTDGTPGGTQLFKDIVPGAGNSNSYGSTNLFSNGSYLLFNVNTGGIGSELWTSNGTDAGTMALKDINPGAPSSNADDFASVNGAVIFKATTATQGTEWWRTDGTAAGTYLLKDIYPGTVSSTPFIDLPPFIFNNKAFFMANDGSHGEEIWVTDGAGNTDLLKDIQSGPIAFTSLFNAVKIGNKFFFGTSDGLTRFEMWESDGTTAGTKLFKAFDAAGFDGAPLIFPPNAYDYSNYTVSQPLFQGNKFFFTAGTAEDGIELWISDGTLAGTHIVKNIAPADEDGVMFGSYAYGSDYFYFAADDGATGLELYRSNGTEAGTSRVADINPGMPDSDPSIYLINNGKLLFGATDGAGVGVTDFYVVDGVMPLPVNLLRFTVLGRAADAVIQWSTAGEINSRDFIVQRSVDGIHFEDIATVDASGTSTLTNAYNYVDAGILNSGKAKVYYRLNQRNRDGSARLSSTISLNIKSNNKLAVRLAQNPVRSQLPVVISSSGDKMQLSIRDLSGKTVYSTSVIANGLNTLQVSQLPSGVYVLSVTSGNEQKTIRFLKQ